MSSDQRYLQSENSYALALVQAMLGAITPNFRSVSISEATDDSLTMHFVLAEENAADREEIDDIQFEFQALQTRLIDVTTKIVVTTAKDYFDAVPGRRIYTQKQS